MAQCGQPDELPADQDVDSEPDQELKPADAVEDRMLIVPTRSCHQGQPGPPGRMSAVPTQRGPPPPSSRPESPQRSRSPSPNPWSPWLLSPGYEQYRQSLLEVPVSPEYGEASSDDLSSEWDSDVQDVSPLVPKVLVLVE